jgi:hypothetical protein
MAIDRNTWKNNWNDTHLLYNWLESYIM